jgi:hypothetical protein
MPEISRMLPRVNGVRYLGDYCLELSFTDGLRGEVDFKDRIVGRGGMIRPLAEIEFFKQVRLDPEAGTNVWPNGVDFCPDVLHSLAAGRPISISQTDETPAMT